MTARLEHVNITVASPERTADMLCRLFGWRIRWSGPAKGGGRSIHVGDDDAYVALYNPNLDVLHGVNSYDHIGGLNHVALVVPDLDATEKRVLDAGYVTHSHGDYDPGRRFYFHDADNIEFEVVSYAR